MTYDALDATVSRQSQYKKNAATWITPLALAAVSLLAGWLLAGGHNINLHVPLIYSGDGLLILMLIKRIIENPWIFYSSAMGAPFGSSIYDYPIPDSGSLVVLKIIGMASGSAAVSLNLYFLIGFPLNALAAYFVARKLHVGRILGFTCAFIFTILPFHFLRLPHLFYTWYFAAPLFIWYASRINSGKVTNSQRPVLFGALDVCGLLILSCFGVYYSAFGVLALATAGLIRFLRIRRLASIVPTIIAIFVVTAGIVINISPNLVYRKSHEINIEATQRSPSDTEIYGLKLTQLLLPRPDHRNHHLSQLNSYYSKTFPLVNENSFSALGLIGSVGLVILLIHLINKRRTENDEENLHLLAAVTLVLLLFCTIGGFSSLFSILISPLIRGWNRVSVFIGFCSICGFVLWLQTVVARRAWQRAPQITVAASLALCAFAVWDQTAPACTQCLAADKAQFASDEKFVRAIQDRLPAGGIIYQLPYVGFPETPPQNSLGTYDLGLGYLHSSTLDWSYGAMKGRDGDLFYRELARQPLARQIEVVKKLGVKGLYIDRRGYVDGGAAIESELTTVLNAQPAVVSENGKQIFFDLRTSDRSASLAPGLSDMEIMKHASFVVDALGLRYRASLEDGFDFTREGAPEFISALEGVSARENWGRWSDANVSPRVRLLFNQTLPARFTLRLRVKGFGPNIGNTTTVIIGSQVRRFVAPPDLRDVSLTFDGVAGAKMIEIIPPVPISPRALGIGGDDRKLGIGIQHLSVIAFP